MCYHTQMDTTKKKIKTPRKAIFVTSEVYERFKLRAQKNNRKYGQYLALLLDETKV